MGTPLSNSKCVWSLKAPKRPLAATKLWISDCGFQIEEALALIIRNRQSTIRNFIVCREAASKNMRAKCKEASGQGSMSVVEPHGLGDLGQRGQQAAVHQCDDALDFIEGGVVLDRWKLIDQFANDAAEQVGVKYAGRFGE